MSSLTPEQLSTLRTFVQNSTDPAIVSARTNGQTDVLQSLLNAPASPTVQAWSNNVNKQEVWNAVAENAAQADNISQQRQWAFDRIMLADPLDASLDKVRNGIVATISAAASDPQQLRRGVLRACRRSATLAQATRGGVDATSDSIVALVLVYYGAVDQEDVNAILAA
jgi:hypothetical protein